MWESIIISAVGAIISFSGSFLIAKFQARDEAKAQCEKWEREDSINAQTAYANMINSVCYCPVGRTTKYQRNAIECVSAYYAISGDKRCQKIIDAIGAKNYYTAKELVSAIPLPSKEQGNERGNTTRKKHNI